MKAAHARRRRWPGAEAARTVGAAASWCLPQCASLARAIVRQVLARSGGAIFFLGIGAATGATTVLALIGDPGRLSP